MDTETGSMWRSCKTAFSITLFLAASNSIASAAPPLADYAGRWAATTNDRNIIVVDLVYDKDKQSVSGMIMRPTSAQISLPQVFSAVKGPVSQTKIEEPQFDDKRLRFLAARPSDSKQRSPYEMSLTGHDQALLVLVGAPIAPLPLIRVDKSAVVAPTWDEDKGYMIDEHFSSNADMARLYSEDQADRMNLAATDWNVVGKADAGRRESTRNLLNDGSLHTGADFQRAAVIFQHGEKSDDFLLAHDDCRRQG
jgi:hypothetical protein